VTGGGAPAAPSPSRVDGGGLLPRREVELLLRRRLDVRSEVELSPHGAGGGALSVLSLTQARGEEERGKEKNKGGGRWGRRGEIFLVPDM
jgi:hypothetical protein